MLSKENYELLKSYCTPRVPDTGEGERFEQLQKQGLIKVYSHKTMDLGSLGNFSAPDKWAITELGKDALAEFAQECDKETERKRQQRFENKVSIASVLVPFLTFFIGLIVEHFTGLFEWFVSLFN
ncbi:MAG: hypothetical protein ACOX6U_09095 [Oscillospiraceae bacterium]|jgi:hypothetical protein